MASGKWDSDSYVAYDRLIGLSVPYGPINNIQETFEHPQAIARGVIVEIEVRTPVYIITLPLISFPSIRALERSGW